MSLNTKYDGNSEPEVRFWQRFFLKLRPFGGYAVAQLVEALRYKPEGSGFNS